MVARPRQGSGSGGGAFRVRDAEAALSSRDSIERLWRSMPEEASAFLLETPADGLTLDRFVAFWSSPSRVECTRNKGTVERLRDASYTMAHNYLTLGREGPARALMLNGSFLFECIVSLKRPANVMRLGICNLTSLLLCF